jgi:proteasome lid subunit RPN8/RPN11
MRTRSSPDGDLWVARRAYERMKAKARAAFPRECCGLLLGRFGRIEIARPARNVHPRPERFFEIDPQALVDAHRAARRGGPALLGYYHSHPSGRPVPSAVDASHSAGDGLVWAIIGDGEVTFWRDAPHGFEGWTWRLFGQPKARRSLSAHSPLARLRRWKSRVEPVPIESNTG